MKPALQKTDVGTLNGTPDKRIYWSIISDYDLKTGVCELVDNAIDQWRINKRRAPLHVAIDLDVESQTLNVSDDAGGVPKDELRTLVAPGASMNDPDGVTIGIFGVGSKRAVVALAEMASIKTRHSDSECFQIDVTKEWIESPEWEIPYYRITGVSAGTTRIELLALRKQITEQDVKLLREHLAATYAGFLDRKSFELKVNDDLIQPQLFEKWAFPPGQSPKTAEFTLKLRDKIEVEVQLTAGLVTDRDPDTENYGVYFYCNDRLITKEVRTRDVGYFVSAQAGVPHFETSLCRCIVKLNGPAKSMPWNSSKSGINFGHSVFQAIQNPLIQLVSHFSALSRRMSDNWAEKVLPFTSGTVEKLSEKSILTGKKLALPPLPKFLRAKVETLKDKNKEVLKEKPWTLGLVEAFVAKELVERQKLETSGRIALILLDSTLEIALKDYIVNNEDLFDRKTYPLKELFAIGGRNKVLDAVMKRNPDLKILEKTKYYYEQRNKLIHERATVNVTNSEIENYQELVETVLTKLFGLKF